VRAFPRTMTSMPVSYDASSLLKCTVSMSYIRYFIDKSTDESSTASTSTSASKQTPAQQKEAAETGQSNSSQNRISLTGQDYTRRRQGLD